MTIHILYCINFLFMLQIIKSTHKTIPHYYIDSPIKTPLVVIKHVHAYLIKYCFMQPPIVSSPQPALQWPRPRPPRADVCSGQPVHTREVTPAHAGIKYYMHINGSLQRLRGPLFDNWTMYGDSVRTQCSTLTWSATEMAAALLRLPPGCNTPRRCSATTLII